MNYLQIEKYACTNTFIVGSFAIEIYERPVWSEKKQLRFSQNIQAPHHTTGSNRTNTTLKNTQRKINTTHNIDNCNNFERTQSNRARFRAGRGIHLHFHRCASKSTIGRRHLARKTPPRDRSSADHLGR